MIIYKCVKCKKIIFFWQNNAKVIIKLQNGKIKNLPLCFDCGCKLIEIEKALEAKNEKA
jgi:hypothetical protein